MTVYFDVDRLVKGVEVYPCGITVVKRKAVPSDHTPTGGERKEIVELTAKARQKMLFTMATSSIKMRSMMTLTYPERYPTDGSEVKYHFKRMMAELKSYYAMEMFWFLEFQQRGAPHLHILTDRENPSHDDRAFVARNWVRIIGMDSNSGYMGMGHGATEEHRSRCIAVHVHKRGWEPMKSEDGAVRYMAKYACKTYQKIVPENYRNVGRFWGCTKSVRDNKEIPMEIAITNNVLRNVLADEGHKSFDWDVIPTYLYGSDALYFAARSLAEQNEVPF